VERQAVEAKSVQGVGVSWFSKGDKPEKLNYWQQLDHDYPPGSEWEYMGKRCILLRTHYFDMEFPTVAPSIQYFDDHGVIRTTEVCLDALKRVST
jgi:hypothetical protein